MFEAEAGQSSRGRAAWWYQQLALIDEFHGMTGEEAVSAMRDNVQSKEVE